MVARRAPVPETTETREVAKTATRPRRPHLTFADLPLFASDRDIAEAVVGGDKGDQRRWHESVPILEGRGFPRLTHLYGKRYVPAVLAFYEREYGLRSDMRATTPRPDPEAKTLGDLAREGHERRRQERLAKAEAQRQRR